MNAQEFKTKYYHTLQIDPATKKRYIKLPIDNLRELTYMQESLVDSVLLLTRLEKGHYKSEQMQSAIYWLCKILLVSYPHEELDGLAEWFKT